MTETAESRVMPVSSCFTRLSSHATSTEAADNAATAKAFRLTKKWFIRTLHGFGFDRRNLATFACGGPGQLMDVARNQPKNASKRANDSCLDFPHVCSLETCLASYGGH